VFLLVGLTPHCIIQAGNPTLSPPLLYGRYTACFSFHRTSDTSLIILCPTIIKFVILIVVLFVLFYS